MSFTPKERFNSPTLFVQLPCNQLRQCFETMSSSECTFGSDFRRNSTLRCSNDQRIRFVRVLIQFQIICLDANNNKHIATLLRCALAFAFFIQILQKEIRNLIEEVFQFGCGLWHVKSDLVRMKWKHSVPQ